MTLNLDRKTKEYIEHCILAHSGKKEFGSPNEPATLEALVVNLCDNVDTNCTSLLENLNPTTGEGYCKSMQRRVVDINKIFE